MKSFASSLKSFVKNLGRHAAQVALRRESGSEAFQRIRTDGRKLKQALSGERAANRREAQHWVRRGRRKYNAQAYEEAETCFREALAADPQCTLALTYLGHSYYKRNMLQEALLAWQRAYEQDPRSDAGQKAYQKLRYVEKQKLGLLAELEDRLE